MVAADFERLLDIVLPGRGGLAVMLEAYFDESERTSGIFAVAGFAFAKEQAKRFSKEWSALFAQSGICRMSELAAGNGRFRSVPEAERDRLHKAAIRLINKRVSFGVAVSCHVGEMDQRLPKWVKGFEHAYPVCCHMAAVLLGKQARESQAAGSIAYFFEAGHRFAGSAHFLMGYANGSQELREAYCYKSHSFVSKADATPLQAADMLAWEWAKYRDETVSERKRPMRKSLVSLFAVPGPNGKPVLDKRRYSITHLEGWALQRFCNGIANLAVTGDASS